MQSSKNNENPLLFNVRAQIIFPLYSERTDYLYGTIKGLKGVKNLFGIQIKEKPLLDIPERDYWSELSGD